MTNWPVIHFNLVDEVVHKYKVISDFVCHSLWFEGKVQSTGGCKITLYTDLDQELICEIRPKNSVRSIEDVVRIILEDNN